MAVHTVRLPIRERIDDRPRDGGAAPATGRSPDRRMAPIALGRILDHPEPHLRGSGRP